jgi:AcrR family transcriptional regulator
MPRRSREEALATRAQIVDRAMTVASTEGLEGLTIGRLADDVGMSKSGVIGHFQTKEGLQVAALEQAGEVFRREVVEPARAHPAGAERLRAIADHWISYLERRVFPGGCFFAAATMEYDDRPGPVRDRLEAGQRAWQSYIARHAELAGHDDPRQTAFEMYALILGTNATYQLQGDAAVFDRARSSMRRLLGDGKRT